MPTKRTSRQPELLLRLVAEGYLGARPGSRTVIAAGVGARRVDPPPAAVRLYPTSEYRRGRSHPCEQSVVLGYACLTEQEIAEAIGRLAAALEGRGSSRLP